MTFAQGVVADSLPASRLSQVPSAVLFLDGSNLFYTAKTLGKRVPYEHVLRALQSRYDMLGKYVYLRNGYAKEAEYFTNIGINVVPVLVNCDAPMSFDISEIVKTNNPSTIIIGSHDGGFVEVAERLEKQGHRVVFLVYRQSAGLSSFIRSRSLIDIDQLLSEMPTTSTVE